MVAFASGQPGAFPKKAPLPPGRSASLVEALHFILLSTVLLLLHFRLRRDNSGVFDYQDCWDPSPEGKGRLENHFDGSRPFKRVRSPPQTPLFMDQPDLTSLIDTNFLEQAKAAAVPEPRHRVACGRQKELGYDFSRLVEKVYEEQSTSSCTNLLGFSVPHGQVTFGSQADGTRAPGGGEEDECSSTRRSSLGAEPLAKLDRGLSASSWDGDFESSIWSLELQGNLIVAGRSNGRLEVSKGAGMLMAKVCLPFTACGCSPAWCPQRREIEAHPESQRMKRPPKSLSWGSAYANPSILAEPKHWLLPRQCRVTQASGRYLMFRSKVKNFLGCNFEKYFHHPTAWTFRALSAPVQGGEIYPPGSPPLTLTKGYVESVPASILCVVYWLLLCMVRT